MKKDLLPAIAIALFAITSCSDSPSSVERIPVPDDFSSTWYYNNNSSLLSVFDPADSIGLARHYVSIGKDQGLDYRKPGEEVSSSSNKASSSSTPQLSSRVPTSSSQIPLSSSYVSEFSDQLPEQFRAEEYCLLNSDLASHYSISNCASLTSTQKHQLEEQFVHAGVNEERWWNLQVQCEPRENSPTEFPCDYLDYFYRINCTKLPEDQRCLSPMILDSLRAHYFEIGRLLGVVHHNRPDDFTAQGYCNLNPDLKAIYGPECPDQPLGWHYSLFASKENRLYKEEASDTQFDDYVAITTEPPFKIIGYVQGGTAHTLWNEEYMRQMTHVVVFGPEVATDGSIIWKNVDLTMLKYWGYWGSKMDTRVMVAFGGWNKSAGFPAMASSPTARAKFLNELAELKDYFVYGIDIDWEGSDYDHNQPTTAVNELLQEMKQKLQPLGMKVSIALHATGPAGINVDGYGAVDWINVMCYDGSNHGTMTKLNECMTGYAANYKSKAVMGFPFYYPTGPSAKGYAQGGTGGLVNLEGVAQATTAIKNNGFAGFMAWSMEHDYHDAAQSLMYKAAATAGYNP